MSIELRRKLRLYIYIFILTILLLFIFKYYYTSVQNTKETLINGSLDIRNIDITSESVELDGEWSFYYGATIFSDNFKTAFTPDAKNTKLVSWKEMGYSNNGVGTYRVLIKKDSKIKELALKLTSVNTSYKLYVNGDLINGIGNPSLLNINDDAKVTHDYHFFNVPGDVLEIIIHVFNTDYYSGGILRAPVLGTQRNMQLIKDGSFASEVFLGSCLIIISFMLLSFYLGKSDESSMVHLGFATFFYVVKILLSITGPVYFIYYLFPFEILIKAFNVFGVVSLYFIFEYFHNTFKKKNDKLALFIRILIQIYILIIIFTKIKYFNIVNIVGVFLSGIVYIYAFLKASRDLFKHRKDAILNFSGALVLLISFSLDIDNSEISKFRIIGLTIFCVIILLDMIKDYISTYENLKLIRGNLESEIENRTLEIANININLKKETSARQKAEENLKSISNYDLDTGIFTKDYAENYLEDLMSVYFRHKHVFSIIIWKIDDLDYIRKTFGESIYERVISETIEIVKSLLRRTDLLADLDDNKYIIIMPNCEINNTVTATEKVRVYVESNIIDGFGAATVSLGLACVNTTDSVQSILNRANNNFNKAIESGKNSYFPRP